MHGDRCQAYPNSPCILSPRTLHCRFVFLFIENAYLNDFFFHDPSENLYDFKKFNFFQCLTVIGGLLMLVVLLSKFQISATRVLAI